MRKALVFSVPFFLSLVCWWAMPAAAQESREGGISRTYLPSIQNTIPTPTPTATNTPMPTPPPGSRPPLSREDCSTVGYVRSSDIYQNGTRVEELQAKYLMHPGDFAQQFRRFFPDGIVNVYDGTQNPSTRVCLPPSYKKAYSQVGSSNFDERLYAEMDEGRPEWPAYLEDSASLAASLAMSETYAILGVAITGDFFGSEIVGSIKFGSGKVANIVKVATGGTAQALLSRAVGVYVGANAVYQRITAATTEGVTQAATVLGGGAAIVYYGRETAVAYLSCGNSIINTADGMLVPPLRRLYLNGNGDAGCILSSEPMPGVSGAIEASWQVAQKAAETATAQKQTDDQEVADLLIAIDTMLMLKGDPDYEPKEVPGPHDYCDSLQHDVELLVIDVRYTTAAAVDYTVNHTFFTTGEEAQALFDLIEFSDAAVAFLEQLSWEDRYREPGPRGNMLWYTAHLTTDWDNHAPDPEGFDWQIQAVCAWVGPFGYMWFADISHGRVHTGLERNDMQDGRFTPPFGYPY